MKPFTEEHKRKIGDARRGKKRPDVSIRMTSEKHPQWKGDDVCYTALHAWVKRHKPKPELCEKCKENPPHDLCNISGEYKRDLNDFEWLCRKCHMESDGRLDKLKERIIKQNQEGPRTMGKNAHWEETFL